MTTPDKQKVWFPAKKNGWGWGLPVTWQGWVVLLSYCVIVVVLSIVNDPKEGLITWGVPVLISTIILLLVCYWKGDPPSWQWKKIEKDKRKWFK